MEKDYPVCVYVKKHERAKCNEWMAFLAQVSMAQSNQ